MAHIIGSGYLDIIAGMGSVALPMVMYFNMHMP